MNAPPQWRTAERDFFICLQLLSNSPKRLSRRSRAAARRSATTPVMPASRPRVSTAGSKRDVPDVVPNQNALMVKASTRLPAVAATITSLGETLRCTNATNDETAGQPHVTGNDVTGLPVGTGLERPSAPAPAHATPTRQQHEIQAESVGLTPSGQCGERRTPRRDPPRSAQTRAPSGGICGTQADGVLIGQQDLGAVRRGHE